MPDDEIKKCCVTCKLRISCEILQNNPDYQKLDQGIFSLERFKFINSFICDNYKCKYIEYPIDVSKIIKDHEVYTLERESVGKFVKIRPCSKECNDKTYLGLFLGDLPIGHNITHNSTTKELTVKFMSNPAIFVFDLNKIVYGCESWWGVIESEDDLREITNSDINNQWYVKALTEVKSHDSNLEIPEEMQTPISDS